MHNLKVICNNFTGKITTLNNIGLHKKHLTVINEVGITKFMASKTCTSPVVLEPGYAK